jgi:uncharacterized membrane protein YfcA
MIYILGFILLGLFAGMLSGIIGIGGGIIIIPALVFIFGLSQQMAQGTTLALLVPPIGIFAAWAYYKQGYVDMKIALLICIGFIIGGLIGGQLATELPTKLITRIFGGALVLIGIRMIAS